MRIEGGWYLFDDEVERPIITAVVEDEALDFSVLGRDILSLFAVIVDDPQRIVCLLSQRHSYTIVES